MNTLACETILRVLVLGAACTLLFLLPILLLWAGMKKSSRWCIVAGAIWLLLSCGFVAFVADIMSVHASGRAPFFFVAELALHECAVLQIL